MIRTHQSPAPTVARGSVEVGPSGRGLDGATNRRMIELVRVEFEWLGLGPIVWFD